MHKQIQETTCKLDAPAASDAEPLLSLDKFTEQSGLSSVTVWRFRRKGFLQTVNICGRLYLLRSEILRFNARAAAGEFARPVTRPTATKGGL